MRYKRIIRIFKNGKYIYTTTRFSTCKEAVADCRNRGEFAVAGSDEIIKICEGDKITAKIDGDVRFV